MQDVPWGLNLFLQKTRAILSTVLGWGGRAYILYLRGIHIYTNNSILPKQGSPNCDCWPHQKESSTDLEAGVLRVLTQASGDNGRFLGPSLLCCWNSSAKVTLKLPGFLTCWLNPAISQRLQPFLSSSGAAEGDLHSLAITASLCRCLSTKETRMNRPGPEKGPCRGSCVFLGHFTHSISISSWLQWGPRGQQGDLTGMQRNSIPWEAAI